MIKFKYLYFSEFYFQIWVTFENLIMDSFQIIYKNNICCVTKARIIFKGFYQLFFFILNAETCHSIKFGTCFVEFWNSKFKSVILNWIYKGFYAYFLLCTLEDYRVREGRLTRHLKWGDINWTWVQKNYNFI